MNGTFTRWDAAEHLRTPEGARLYLEACAEEDPGDGGVIRAAGRHRPLGKHEPAGARGRDGPSGTDGPKWLSSAYVGVETMTRLFPVAVSLVLAASSVQAGDGSGRSLKDSPESIRAKADARRDAQLWNSQAGAAAEPDCRDWNTQDFFNAASASDVAQCLAAGEDVEDSNGGLTPLMQAAEYGSAETVKTLLTAGANVGTSSPFGSMPLHFAVASGSAEKVAALLAAGADIKATDGILENTPLHLAAHETALIVNTLLAAGADIEARDEFGRTPLHTAAEYGSTETVNALLEAGADPMARDRFGATPLLLAGQKGTAGTVEAMRTAGGLSCTDWQRRGFFRAATASFISYCVAAGIDIEERFGEGFGEEGGITALQMAAAYGTAETVGALLEAGAEINAAHALFSIGNLEMIATPFFSRSWRATPRPSRLSLTPGPTWRHRLWKGI